MKNLVIAMLLLLPLVGLCQNPNRQINRIYKAAERGEDVHKIAVPGFLIRSGFNIASILEQRELRKSQSRVEVVQHNEEEVTMKDLKPLIRAIRGAKILVVENEYEIPTEAIQKSLKKLKQSNVVEPLLKVKSDGADVNIMIAEKGNKIKNLILLVSDDGQLVMINLKTKLKMDQLSDLIKLFKKKDTVKAIRNNVQA